MLISLFFNLFIVAWAWLTIRLKTKKHTIIRTIVSAIFTIFNFIGVIVLGCHMNDDKEVYLFLIIFYLIFLLLWGIRLIFDLLFISKNCFEKEEVELLRIIKEKLNINVTPKNTTNDFICDEKKDAEQNKPKKDKTKKEKHDFTM